LARRHLVRSHINCSNNETAGKSLKKPDSSLQRRAWIIVAKEQSGCFKEVSGRFDFQKQFMSDLTGSCRWR